MRIFRWVGAVILAAGGSRRMGRPKPLLPLGGRPLLLRHVEALAEATDDVVVVLGAGADRVAEVLPDSVGRVHNEAWARSSPIDSLVLGLRALEVGGADGFGDRGPTAVLVTPVDVLPASADTLRALRAAGGPAVPVDARGRRGHPVLLDRALAEALVAHPPPGGLRDALVSARQVLVDDPWIAEDFDDPEAFDRVVRGWREPGVSSRG